MNGPSNSLTEATDHEEHTNPAERDHDRVLRVTMQDSLDALGGGTLDGPHRWLYPPSPEQF